MNYRIVSGIETHIELSTKSKIFCGCSTRFGAPPNTQCCPVCTGQPGALPSLNMRAVQLGIRAGLALHCRISPRMRFDRKNYFYPDLPKGYQITQYDLPLCTGGYVQLESGRRIRIERVHLEEDAGKLIHQNGSTYIDYNRSGVPLIEVVSMPDISSPQEAREYVEQLQLIMRYAGVSDCRMQEGSMRCDINISLVKDGEAGTRTEIKNMNSPAYIARAMQAEAERQRKILLGGGRVERATLRYDEASGRTVPMRLKEGAEDYRYFPEPDLPEITISRQFTESAGALPEMPHERFERHISLGVSANHARILCRYVAEGAFFYGCVKHGADAAKCSNLIAGTVFALITDDDGREEFFKNFPPEDFARLVRAVTDGKIGTTLAQGVLEKVITRGGAVVDYLTAQDMRGIDVEELRELCRAAVAADPVAAADYRAGKLKAIGAFFGYIKRASEGRADIPAAEAILKELLKN